ncbi:BrxE family protein [Prevotella sp. AGR2160]|uniref:BrxE family protein n=1 Tax=Prevotella sp. AGR2160 TaxID=1280674 RepID=UPI00041D7EA7|nr:BrxE family protein [Prevotella sp. AGR2160]
MTEQQIKDILALRYAVYKLGAEKGFWQDLEKNSAKPVMDYLFARTSNIAYYNMMLETCKSKHTGNQGEYNLFKLPARTEEELLNYMKTHLDLNVSTLVKEPVEYLQQKAIVTIAPTDEPVNIGRMSEHDTDTLLALIASVYQNAFTKGANNYPYFE